MKGYFTISTRLMFAFALLVLVNGISSIIAIRALGTSSAKVKAVVEERMQKERLASEWSNGTLINGVRTEAILKSSDALMTNLLTPGMEKTSNRASAIQQELTKSMEAPEEKAMLAEVAKRREAYSSARKQAIKLKADGKDAEASSVVDADVVPALRSYVEVLDQLAGFNKEKINQLGPQLLENTSHTIRTLLVFLVASIVFSALAAWIIIKSITGPLKMAVQVANSLADGDLTVDVTVTSGDETGLLMSAMKNMVEHLRQLVSATVDISAGIASASTQLHTTSAHIADGVSKAALQTDTVATASAEMAATSTDIATNCVMAVEAARQSTASANAGASIVHESISGMKVIAERVRRSSETVEALGARSEQIGAIIGTIEDIADQTNLLALNAAIEAARAGEQGRGFAVVADEVRALAVRTTKATKEIGEMIKAIQGETRSAVRAMDEGVREAEKEAGAAEKSEEALADILVRIDQVALQVSQIATAAEQQTATTGEVTSNIHQITNVIQTTANGADQTADAAAKLSQQALELHSLVSRFKL
jgi:methyl-accepting chemotaxis protein